MSCWLFGVQSLPTLHRRRESSDSEKNRLAEIKPRGVKTGHRSRVRRLRRKTPKTTFVFGASKQPVRVNTRPAKGTFFYPDYHCRPRSYTGSCLLYAAPVSQKGNCHCPKRLVGFTTDREFHPAPKVNIRLSKIIPQTIQPLQCTPPGKPKRTWASRCDRRIRRRWPDQSRRECHRLR